MTHNTEPDAAMSCLNSRSRALRLRQNLGLLAWLAVVGLGPNALAQSVTLTPRPPNLLVGANYSGVYTNLQLVASVSGVGGTPVTLDAVAPPAGVTVTFSTNNFTSSQTPFVNVAVTNLAKGVYPLTIAASGGANFTTNFNLIVGDLWTNASAAAINWSTAENWSLGSPANGDDVLFQDAGGNTNNVDGSVALNSLSFIRNLSGTNHNLSLAPGVTLAVTGAPSLMVNVASIPGNNKTMTLNVSGAGATVLVSNQTANVAVNGISGSGVGTTVVMTNLSLFKSFVSRFCLGDYTTSLQGVAGTQTSGGQGTRVDLARTNLIHASYVGDYTATNVLLTPVSYANNGDGNNGGTLTLNLGYNNTVQADAAIFGQGKAGGGSSVVQFNPVFTNQRPTITFRNLGNTRMSLLGVGIDSGTATNSGNNSRMILNLNNGYVDMLVDKIWLGRNRLYSSSPNNVNRGNLQFNDGVINVNTLMAGYQAYTGEGICNAQVTVGGGSRPALLQVNEDLALGYTAGDWGGGNAGRTWGQLVISTNGTIRTKQITLGTLSTNNTITINGGGVLDSLTGAGTTAKAVTTLTVNGNGAAITLHLDGANTLYYVTNLTTSASGNYLNIASVSNLTSFPITIPVISYQNGAAASFTAGSVNAGIPGLRATVVNNTLTKTIDVTLTVGEPKTLLWQGASGNSQWNTVNLNWKDTATGSPTNFATGDFVIFDDTAGASTVELTEDVVPGQAAGLNGITITNNTLDYTFSGFGRILGSATLRKVGGRPLRIDAYTEVAVNLTAGELTGWGTVGSAAIASGARLNWPAGSSFIGGLSCSGVAVNAGAINGGATLLSGGVLTNSGSIAGVLVLQANTIVMNSGSLSDIGSTQPTVNTNSLLINEGTISGSALNVSGTLIDLVPSSASVNPGSIVVGTLTINAGGTFLPGGSGISTTKVSEYPQYSAQPSGRVLLGTGSTTVFRVDWANAQPYTKLLSRNQGFGGSQNYPAFNGGTIVISNLNSGMTFAAGQTLKLFGNYYNDGNIFDSGLNSTNSLPIIQPPTPGPGLVWDATGLIPGGVIGVVEAAAKQISLSSSVAVGTTNIIGTYSWPETSTGGWLQQQFAWNTNGIGVNWNTVAGSWLTNSISVTNEIVPGQSIFYRFVHP